MNEQLKKLYKTVILEHDKKPVQYVKRAGAQHVLKAYNEICGDRFELFFDIENDQLTNVSFHGFGCAISKASTSVLVKKIQHQTVEQAQNIITAFLQTVHPDSPGGGATDEEMTAFSAAKDFPGRLKCATLAWDELKEWLSEHPEA